MKRALPIFHTEPASVIDIVPVALVLEPSILWLLCKTLPPLTVIKPAEDEPIVLLVLAVQVVGLVGRTLPLQVIAAGVGEARKMRRAMANVRPIGNETDIG
jgi:hypothetical protein